jgi:hypothetical protein
MKRLYHPYIYLVILFVYVFTNCSSIEKQAMVEKTFGQQQSWALNFLNENILSLHRLEDSVAFRTTAKLGIGQWGYSWNQNFSLGREGEFFLSPDHHLKVSFRISSIDSTSVQIKYEYKFDHRSFGKELISIDTGEIRFNYK